MIATAQIAIQPQLHHRPQVQGPGLHSRMKVCLLDSQHLTRQLPRGRVVLRAGQQSRSQLRCRARQVGRPARKSVPAICFQARHPASYLRPQYRYSARPQAASLPASPTLPRWWLPFRPCSSPATATKIRVAGNFIVDRTLAVSSDTAVPLESSFAPGANP